MIATEFSPTGDEGEGKLVGWSQGLSSPSAPVAAGALLEVLAPAMCVHG